ncbi:PP2C family protein-serine/threonine phosphatase [Demequina sp.]|uniref:PP2C family protein-serine/threonine phosphatase n=1 Tax=Demequina sp. TaxID=2050685 RepID=UPI003D0EFD1B
MTFLAFHYAARTDVGLTRANNQDSGYAGPHLLLVADGMGGAAGGDIASSIAVGRLAALDEEALGPDEALDELKTAISEAHAQIVGRARNDPELSGLGTTVTALLRSGSTLAMAHIGDSRAYLLRQGTLDQVTSDHTFVQHLVDTGRLSVADAENHPKRNLILRVLGDIDANVPVDISVRETKPGDRWMVCSDGLSGVVSRDTIHTTMLEVEDPGDCADALVALALAAGAPDNVTCIIGDIVDIDEAPDGVGPSTAAQVVGAAALDRHRPSGAADTPAARAAKLTEASAEDEEEDVSRWGSFWERWRGWGLTIAVIIALAAAAWGAYAWTQNQYFIGEHDGVVAIYRGVPGEVGPVELSTVLEDTDIALDSLQPYARDRIEATIRVSGVEEARAVIAGLQAGV